MRRVLVIVFVLLVAGSALLWFSINRPYAGFEGELLIDIPRGTGSKDMAALLAEKGVLFAPWEFLVVRAFRRNVALQAGEYRFAGPASAWQVFDRLASGDIHYYELRVPEGSNVFEVARIVGGLGFVTAAQMERAASNTSLVADLAPQARNLEGYLFPSTYRVTRQMTAEQICRIMVEEFRRQWRETGGSGAVHETVTLASLVEKETGRGQERATVASVYRNRLALGMKLECDPTTIYAALLQGRYRGEIHRSDLESRHPYNTYQNEGLPPGPIANPGRAAIEAALRPAETNYLFFVAKPGLDGGHIFSATISQHTRAVAEYRRGQGKQAQPTRTVSRTGKTGRG